VEVDVRIVKDTQKTSQDLWKELKGLVAIEKLTAYDTKKQEFLEVFIVIPKDVDKFKDFLEQNHEQIFADYQALVDKKARSYEKSLYNITLKACGYLYAMSIPTGKANELCPEIIGFSESHREEFNNISRYSRQVSGVSISLQRKNRSLNKLDNTTNYDIDKLSQIIREARFVLNYTPELFQSHSVYTLAKEIDKLAQQSRNPSVQAAYEAVTNEERLAVVTREATEMKAHVDQVDEAFFLRMTPEEEEELTKQLEQLVASEDPPDLGQGPPGSGKAKEGDGNIQRNEKQTLTTQQGIKMRSNTKLPKL
jgi:hypothetical protein